MPNRNESQRLLLCDGKDCFEKANGAFNSLMAIACEAGLSVGTVKCQGACSGPTAVVVGADGPRWFEDLKGAKVQRDVCALADGSRVDPPKRLARKELTGKAREKAAKRFAKQS